MSIKTRAPVGRVTAEAEVGPPKYPVLEFFDHQHLSPPLRELSQMFGDMARTMTKTLPCHPETSAGLRKLLEAKDCFVRSALTAIKKGDALGDPEEG